jgi:hypothetical protein
MPTLPNQNFAVIPHLSYSEGITTVVAQSQLAGGPYKHAQGLKSINHRPHHNHLSTQRFALPHHPIHLHLIILIILGAEHHIIRNL